MVAVGLGMLLSEGEHGHVRVYSRQLRLLSFAVFNAAER
jgi:hypothetical protein